MHQEIRQLKEKIGVLTAELERTKADNVKLYGKIRYVQDYNNEKVVSRGSKKVLYLTAILVLESHFSIFKLILFCHLVVVYFSMQRILKVDSHQMLNPSTRRYMKTI